MNIEQGISNEEVKSPEEAMSVPKLIIISPEKNIENEISIVNALFDAGLQLFHLRKPDFTAKEQEQYLSEIQPQYLKNIAIHQHHAANCNNGIRRFHFKESERRKQHTCGLILIKNQGICFSTSLHDANEINTVSPVWDYVFLGPVAASLSKPGYRNDELAELKIKREKNKPPLIALGGITPDNAESIINKGYDGMAVLGAIWQNPSNAMQTFKTLKGICSN